jgi:signal-transduction protein with cAMP-binding, CBS, and nucleotidyltransferase domain
MDKLLTLLLNQHNSIANIDDSVEIIENKIKSRGADCVIVTKHDGKCFGVITNTDIALFHEKHKNSKTVKAWELCSPNVIYVSPETSIKEISDLMMKNKVHHIVILENGIAKGYISSNDLLEYDFIQTTLKNSY